MISVQQDRNFATRIKLKKPTFVLKQFQSENVFSVSKVLFELNPLEKEKANFNEPQNNELNCLACKRSLPVQSWADRSTSE